MSTAMANAIYTQWEKTSNKDLYPMVCDWLQEHAGDPRVQAWMHSKNKVLECNPDVITLSQEDEFTDSDGVFYKFDRASFFKRKQMIYYCYESSQAGTCKDWDGEEFSDIRVEIDDDQSLHLFFRPGKGTHEVDPITGYDKPIHTIPYLNANAEQIAQLVAELETRGVPVTKTPALETNSIRHVLAFVRASGSTD